MEETNPYRDVSNSNDSGTGSLSSESDISPSLNTHGRVLLPSQSQSSKQPAVERATLRKTSNAKKFSFETGYLGQLEIDKRYVQPQFWKVILQWLVAEIRRKFSLTAVNFNIADGRLCCLKLESGVAVLEADLINISKFSRTHLDTSCFAFVTKKTEFTYVCHVFKAKEESTVSTFVAVVVVLLLFYDRYEQTVIVVLSNLYVRKLILYVLTSRFWIFFTQLEMLQRLVQRRLPFIMFPNIYWKCKHRKKAKVKILYMKFCILEKL